MFNIVNICSFLFCYSLYDIDERGNYKWLNLLIPPFMFFAPIGSVVQRTCLLYENVMTSVIPVNYHLYFLSFFYYIFFSIFFSLNYCVFFFKLFMIILLSFFFINLSNTFHYKYNIHKKKSSKKGNSCWYNLIFTRRIYSFASSFNVFFLYARYLKLSA